MEDWNEYGTSLKMDQSIILYHLGYGKVSGGSDPDREVKQVQKDSVGNILGGDFTLELDLSNRILVMEVNNEKITLDDNIGDFQYSPIVIFGGDVPEITLL